MNPEALEARFGEWPAFQDVEVLSVRLDSGQRSDGVARLELDVHVFAVDGVLANGRLKFVRHTVATLQFEGVEDVELGVISVKLTWMGTRAHRHESPRAAA